MCIFRSIVVVTCALLFSGFTLAADPFDKIGTEVNYKLVKIFGAGGFSGASPYGSGIVISPKGHILTAYSQLLDTQELRVHLSDGRRFFAKLLFIEPELDSAVIQLIQSKEKREPIPDLDIPYFDVPASIKAMKIEPGDWVLAFSNCFSIAQRDEPMSIQRANVTSIAKLAARRGIHEVPFHGEVFFLDGVTNNPGSAGGALTTRKGQLVGLLGKEFRNLQSDTWINYAIPLNCTVEVEEEEKKRVVSMEEFVTKSIEGNYVRSRKKTQIVRGQGGYHGIIFVPNLFPQTPAYIDRVITGSPAHKAGLKPDDQVVYVDGEPVLHIAAFNEMLAKLGPGAKLQIEIRRKDKLTAIELELADFPKK